MRGRTNIPPRIGGIVNGVVTECVVSETNGIEMGDYVQLVEGTGTQSTNPEYFINNWMYGPFLLSDGSIATMFYYSGNLYASRATIGVSGFVNESIRTPLDLSTMGSFNSSSMTSSGSIYVMELEQNKFLLLIHDGSTGRFGIIEYSEEEWSITNLTVSNFTFPTSSPYLRSARMCKISSTKIALTASNKKVYIAEVSGSTITFGSSLDSGSSYSTPWDMRYINGYLIISYNGYLSSYSVSGLSVILVSNDVVFTGAYGFSTTQLTSNKFLCISGSSSSGYVNILNGYLYAKIITIDGNGTISMSSNTTAIHYDITVSVVSNTASSNGRFTLGYPSMISGNRLFVAVPLIAKVKGSSSSINNYQIIKLYACVGTYNTSTDTVEFPDLETIIGENITASVSSMYPFSLPVIETSEKLYFVSGGGYEETQKQSYQFVTKVEQTTIVDLTDKPIVKKYSSRINGVAKTSGSNGSTIEVYAPAKLS